MKSSLFKISRFIHKWAGLFLAVQILLWILGGLVMSAIPLEKVHGKHLAKRHLETQLNSNEYTLSLDKLVVNSNRQIEKIEWVQILDEPYYKVVHDEGTVLYHAVSGEIFSGLQTNQVSLIAQQHYLGNSGVASIDYMTAAPKEASAYSGPLWQVVFDDKWNTTLYISDVTASLATVRSDIWRIFDFFWMLHIMDYDQREDFNNPLLISFAAFSVVFTLSGFILLIRSFPALRGRSRGNVSKR